MKRRLVIAGAFVAVLLALPVLFLYVLTDPRGQPSCHKIFMMGVTGWQDTNGKDSYPNINGSSEQSLAELTEFVGEDLSSRYMYVAGLKQTDPGHLVLMYVNRPTRWTWHGKRPTVFQKKAWIVVPADMKFYGPKRETGPGEMSERISFEEFQQRLEETLEFLEQEERPHWQATVKEHRRFLEQVHPEE